MHTHRKDISKLLSTPPGGSLLHGDSRVEATGYRERSRPIEGQPVAPRIAYLIRILIVDDSPMMRRLITRILDGAGGFAIVGFACDGYQALQRVAELAPNIVILDWNMPGPDGRETLSHIRELFPEVMVLMCSTLTTTDSTYTACALKLGAADVIAKPGGVQTNESTRQQFAIELTRKLRAMWHSRSASEPTTASHASQRAFAAVKAPHVVSAGRLQRGKAVAPSVPEVFAIGASTGGPAALSIILPMLPADFHLPVVVVQHMPAYFTRLLAERLSTICRLRVIEAQDGMEIEQGTIFVAPGGYHMRLVRKHHLVKVQLSQDVHVNSCRPAVDVLFGSIAKVYGASAIALVLTGMGQDGLQGVRALKDEGSRVLVQDKASSVVWGMPGAIAGAGLADATLPLEAIIPQVIRML